MRDEGDDPGGDPEANEVYDNLGEVFDYYSETFGRDSYDDAGADLIASINFCETPGTPMTNAYWDGTQMVFGDGYASSLDITAHELTHAVTEETAGLEYQCQSGALNESMSDIFASNVDSDDWEIGEDLPGGAIRDMANPANGDPPQPAHVDDFREMPNDGNPYNDHGGVHYNSGIPNHAYYLMVQAIGREAAEQIVYRALTEKLEPDSGFEDFRTASLEVARGCGARTAPSTGARTSRSRRSASTGRGKLPRWRDADADGDPGRARAGAGGAGCGADDERRRRRAGRQAQRPADLRARRRPRRPARPARGAARRQREADGAGQAEVGEADRQGARQARDATSSSADLGSLPKDSTARSRCPTPSATASPTTATPSPPTTRPCPSGCAGSWPGSAGWSTATRARPQGTTTGAIVTGLWTV